MNIIVQSIKKIKINSIQDGIDISFIYVFKKQTSRVSELNTYYQNCLIHIGVHKRKQD